MATLRKIVRTVLSLFEKLPEEEKPFTAQKDRGELPRLLSGG